MFLSRPSVVLTVLGLSLAACNLGNDPEPQPTPTEKPVLLPPTQEARDAAAEIQTALPGAQVQFSQRHSGIVSVSAFLTGAELFDTTTRELPAPLAVTQGTTVSGRASALKTFLQRFPKAFGLNDPAIGFATPTDSANAFLNDSDKSGVQGMSVRINRLVQTYQGLRIRGRYAQGFFDAKGNLYSVLTRLLPLDGSGISAKPSLTAYEATSKLESQLDALVAQNADLKWLRGKQLGQMPNASELLWVPESGEYSQRIRLAYELRLRYGAEEALITVDANTGEVLRAINNMPSEWHDEAAAAVTATAADETGATQSIPSCKKDNTLFMGFGTNVMGSFFATGGYFSINDSNGTNLVWYGPWIQDNTTDLSWKSSRGYTGVKTQMTSMMKGMTPVLNWWKARGWKSWDNRGSGLFTGTNARANEDGSASYNAWGGGGFVQAGGALNNIAGLSLAADVEVMGHEFMHNVIEATSRLVYANESGAINEALADLFGVAVTATSADRLNNIQMGDLGNGIRNMQDPTRSGQPDKYSAFVVTTGDAGGVHTNSGILNKAHYMMIMGDTFRGITVQAQGVRKITDVIRAANTLGRHDPEMSMEEFAHHTYNTCEFAGLVAWIAGDATYRDSVCPNMRKAYQAVELMPLAEHPDLAMIAIKNVGSTIYADVLNQSASGPIDVSRFEIQLIDELGETQHLTIANNWSETTAYVRPVNRDVDWDTDTNTLRTGGRATITYKLPNDWFARGEMIRGRRATLAVVPPAGTPSVSDVNLANNSMAIELKADFFPRGMYANAYPVDSTGTRLDLHIEVAAATGGYPYAPGGLKAVMFVRTTADGPFLPIAGSTSSEAVLAETMPAYDTAGNFTFPRIIAPLGINETWTYNRIELAGVNYTESRGRLDSRPQIWFNTSGGLPELAGHRQYYVLIDPLDETLESDKTNNFMCTNCFDVTRPGGATTIVRLPLGTPVDRLFPAQYQAAARKLLSWKPSQPIFVTPELQINNLDIRRLPAR